ncbi:hypothetical protein N7489_011777 [Penicillium chrysogenum]|uniref:Uncharacterized protein n=1 Tax=Penicillium chrysogenum TaxID=5076 RepID=A0ABQ8W207_PENCH|nr:uncharacterized protein N7489_011777 [Penicillium chrysogenum]KAJ5231069.1 hypothetical protein N7489_011777 [Penicillium chrysogenum]KAJ5253396.1 hypothetical protein N7505_012059 [Penicillium chrysogenum]KAJ5268453.1 hypothetical protein N7524_005912 [Penicillium chrysogenum]
MDRLPARWIRDLNGALERIDRHVDRLGHCGLRNTHRHFGFQQSYRSEQTVVISIFGPCDLASVLAYASLHCVTGLTLPPVDPTSFSLNIRLVRVFGEESLSNPIVQCPSHVTLASSISSVPYIHSDFPNVDDLFYHSVLDLLATVGLRNVMV